MSTPGSPIDVSTLEQQILGIVKEHLVASGKKEVKGTVQAVTSGGSLVGIVLIIFWVLDFSREIPTKTEVGEIVTAAIEPVKRDQLETRQQVGEMRQEVGRIGDELERLRAHPVPFEFLERMMRLENTVDSIVKSQQGDR